MNRVTLLAHTISKNSKKAVYRALFLTRDYNTKSKKSKKLLGKSKFYKVSWCGFNEKIPFECKRLMVLSTFMYFTEFSTAALNTHVIRSAAVC